ncbi:hypothetical protein [Ancylobacter sp.]|uniref:hypothetical protein n=1 Tax=Ancylobacter sp. TaxID=1872567 RepID=UPI003D0D135D
MKTISSQRFLDDAIVEFKRGATTYIVKVSPAFEIDGETFRVVLDGHHTLEAAKLDGVEPGYEEQTASQNDFVGLLNAGNIDDFLAMAHFGADYFDVETGIDVW